MTQATSDNTISIKIISIIAIAFGLLTIKSGGQVLFGGSAYQQAAGHYVPFVLWFNFLAGFMYLIAGAGIWMRKRWAAWLSLFIAAATVIIFAIFGIHILNGGAYETRTVIAMTLRSTVWTLIFIFSYRKFVRR